MRGGTYRRLILYIVLVVLPLSVVMGVICPTSVIIIILVGTETATHVLNVSSVTYGHSKMQ